MRYLTAEDILVLHAAIVNETGGSHGIRDVGLLASIAHRPQTTICGHEMFKNVFTKTGAYLESLAHYHVFVDGNKRTSIATAARFLTLNGYELTATNNQVEKFVLSVATTKPALADIAAWFKKHSKKV